MDLSKNIELGSCKQEIVAMLMEVFEPQEHFAISMALSNQMIMIKEGGFEGVEDREQIQMFEDSATALAKLLSSLPTANLRKGVLDRLREYGINLDITEIHRHASEEVH